MLRRVSGPPRPRVDVVPGPDGPLLLELEATDCFLFLSFAAPEVRARLAEHLVERLARGRARRS